MMMTRSRLGFAGVGKMGGLMAARLISADSMLSTAAPGYHERQEADSCELPYEGRRDAAIKASGREAVFHANPTPPP
jgi:3-hydroxyisobutyrate dehydrogenase-like beta-hydroxyacid dehydrogenase